MPWAMMFRAVMSRAMMPWAMMSGTMMPWTVMSEGNMAFRAMMPGAGTSGARMPYGTMSRTLSSRTLPSIIVSLWSWLESIAFIIIVLITWVSTEILLPRTKSLDELFKYNQALFIWLLEWIVMWQMSRKVNIKPVSLSKVKGKVVFLLHFLGMHGSLTDFFAMLPSSCCSSEVSTMLSFANLHKKIIRFFATLFIAQFSEDWVTLNDWSLNILSAALCFSFPQPLSGSAN